MPWVSVPGPRQGSGDEGGHQQFLSQHELSFCSSRVPEVFGYGVSQHTSNFSLSIILISWKKPAFFASNATAKEVSGNYIKYAESTTSTIVKAAPGCSGTAPGNECSKGDIMRGMQFGPKMQGKKIAPVNFYARFYRDVMGGEASVPEDDKTALKDEDGMLGRKTHFGAMWCVFKETFQKNHIQGGTDTNLDITAKNSGDSTERPRCVSPRQYKDIIYNTDTPTTKVIGTNDNDPRPKRWPFQPPKTGPAYTLSEVDVPMQGGEPFHADEQNFPKNVQ